VGGEKSHGVGRIERREHPWVVGDMGQPCHAEGDEPQRHDRPEKRSDVSRAARLHREQRDQDQHRERHHVALQLRRRHLQAFDRRQHRDGWREQRIAVEQGRGDHAEYKDHELGVAGFQCSLGERHQGQCAAFTLVVGAKQDEHILGGDDEEQGPQDQRQHADDRPARQVTLRAASRIERDAERVKRARADVAVNDAHAAKRQRPECSPLRLAVGTVYSRGFAEGPRHSTQKCDGRKLQRLSVNAG
jgi:hypothetical protein